MKYKALFWDNDGTLVDTEALFIASCYEGLQELGVDIDYQWLEDACLRTGKGFLDLVEKGEYDIDPKFLLKVRNEIYVKKIQQGISVLPGIRETLEALKGKCEMGIVTSCPQDNFDLIMEQAQLLPYFDFTITRNDVINSKPHPEPYLKAIKRVGCNPSECLVIEESSRGLQAAKAAGLDCFIIPHTLTAHHDFTGATQVLDSARDLLEYIN